MRAGMELAGEGLEYEKLLKDGCVRRDGGHSRDATAG
jgi:hypothetical protein